MSGSLLLLVWSVAATILAFAFACNLRFIDYLILYNQSHPSPLQPLVSVSSLVFFYFQKLKINIKLTLFATKKPIQTKSAPKGVWN